jgi:hypothetical protein
VGVIVKQSYNKISTHIPSMTMIITNTGSTFLLLFFALVDCSVGIRVVVGCSVGIRVVDDGKSIYPCK